MPDKRKAVAWAVNFANDNRRGYSQARRGGVDGDCSDITLRALRAGGFDTGSATYTGDSLKPLLAAGWVDVTSSINMRTGDGAQPCDVFLRPKTNSRGGHMALAIGHGDIVQAQYDFDGKPGDSSGKEVRVQKYYDSPFKYCLRYPDPVEEKPVGAFGKIVNVREWCHRRSRPTTAPGTSVGTAKLGEDVFINGKRLVNGNIWYHDSAGNWIWGDFVEIQDSAIPWM